MGRPFVFVGVVSPVPEDPQAARQCQQRVAGFAARTQLFDVTKPHQIGPVTAIAFQSTFSSLPENLYSAVNPTAIRQRGLVRLNYRLAEELGLDTQWLRGADGLAMLSGNAVVSVSMPVALAQTTRA